MTKEYVKVQHKKGIIENLLTVIISILRNNII